MNIKILMDPKEKIANSNGNELEFEEDEQIDEENNGEDDAVGTINNLLIVILFFFTLENLEKKIYESQVRKE